MDMRRDTRVDEYIASLPDWQARFAQRVRAAVHAADDEVEETIKRTRLPYFVLKGNICALLGAKDHLNVFVYDPIAPDPEGLINQEGTMRLLEPSSCARGRSSTNRPSWNCSGQ